MRSCLPLLFAGLLPGTAWAAPAAPPLSRAFPGPGATLVSPQSSIYIGAGSAPGPITLEVDGKAVPSAGLTVLGSGYQGSWWRLPGPLTPGASYVVRGQQFGVTRELTRFTTATAADRTPATASVATRLRVWRVQYPRDQIGRFGISREFEGYVDVVYQPGQVPGTPDAEVLTVFDLSPRTGGGPTQTYVVPGRQRIPLAIDDYVASSNPEVPDGGLPGPRYSLWRPTIEPDHEYCITITLHGRNDLAVPPATSTAICTMVINARARGFPDGGAGDLPPPSDASAAAPPEAGVDLSPAPPYDTMGPDTGTGATDAGPDLAAPPARDDGAGDAVVRVEPAMDAAGAPPPAALSNGGCSCSVDRSNLSLPWLTLLAFGLALAFRRRRR